MKRKLIKIVKFSSGVVHVIVTYIANLIYATCTLVYRMADWLALSEGKTVEFIDRKEYFKDVMMERQENTEAVFKSISDKIDSVVSKFGSNDGSERKIKIVITSN